MEYATGGSKMVEYWKIEEKDGKIEAKKEAEVENLTSDCWMVQFRGLDACAECEYFLKPNCGGGRTLTEMILDLGESMYSRWKAEEWWSHHPDGSFYRFIKAMEKEGAFQYGLRKYKRIVKAKRNIETERDLDEEYPYEEVIKEGEVIEKKGRHKPEASRCDCKEPAYRDVIVRIGEKTVYYLHQHPIVVETPKSYIVSSCGWRTYTTKERINRYTGLGVYQKDGVWYLGGDGSRFTDGMEVKK